MKRSLNILGFNFQLNQLLIASGLVWFISSRPPVVAIPWLVGGLIVVLLGKR